MKMKNIVIMFLGCVSLQIFSVDRSIGQAFSSKMIVKNDSNATVEVNPVFAGVASEWTTISGKNDHKYFMKGALSGLFVRSGGDSCYYFNFSQRKFNTKKSLEVYVENGSDMVEVVGYEGEESIDLFFTGKSVNCNR